MSGTTELNTVRRFSDRAADYVKFRPGYPSGAIDAILHGLGPAERLLAADVGAGTGISARLVADRGVRVIAVEPGDDMRRSADTHDHVHWVSAHAEATGLADARLDLVLCAQSFHWFRPLVALREFARILKPRGRLALMWNRRSRVDPLTAGYRQAFVDVAGEIVEERMPFDPDVIVETGLFASPTRAAFPNVQRLDLEGLIGRAQSASYAPKTGASGARLVELLRGLHARHADANGTVALVYETEVYLADRL
jgi:SAM-dependent methyltransferase